MLAGSRNQGRADRGRQTTLTARPAEDTVREVDALVRAGTYRSRADVIKAALDHLLAAERRGAIDRAIGEGYTPIPPQPWELAAS